MPCRSGLSQRTVQTSVPHTTTELRRIPTLPFRNKRVTSRVQWQIQMALNEAQQPPVLLTFGSSGMAFADLLLAWLRTGCQVLVLKAHSALQMPTPQAADLPFCCYQAGQL
jgi:hypothetical protein